MNRIGRIFSKSIPSLIIAFCVILSIVLVSTRDKLIPANPLANPVDSSHMLLNNGGSLNVSKDDFGNVDGSSDSMSNQDNDESSKADDKSNNKSENIYDAEENTSETKDDNIQEEKSNGLNQSQNGLTVNDSTKGESINNNHSGETQKPTGENTDTVYFTTSIKNMETVKDKNYSFTITHKQKNLKVISLLVYINETVVPQFHGNVLLKQGKNTIRVAVIYKDGSGKEIPVYKDYTVFASFDDIVISTDLSDCTVETDRITFFAYASYIGKDVPVTVTSNTGNITQEAGKYTAKLENGNNTITINAKKGSFEKQISFTVKYCAPSSFTIYTDLEDKTVHTETVSFSAYILGGSSKSKLTVIVNGTTISGNENYTASLKIGANTIRIVATDRIDGTKASKDKTFTIQMVPLSSDKTAPKIEYINVTDGMDIGRNEFTLDIGPVDYMGNRIFYNGINVNLNGVNYQYKWDSEYTSYLLYLQNGTNILNIRITDEDGRYADYSYVVNCFSPVDGEKIGQITFSLDANVLGLGYLVEPTKLDIIQGESAADTICRFLKANGFDYEYSGTMDTGFYLSRIIKNGIAVNVNIPVDLKNAIDNDGLEWKDQKYNDSIGEFDYCQGSGWMYSVNEKFPNYGASDAVFQDGDVVCLRFTLCYGKDIGGSSASNAAGGNYDKIW